MRTINIWALVLVILGIVIFVLDQSLVFASFTGPEWNHGFATLFFTFPLVIIGIIVWIVGLFTKKR